MKKSMVLRDLTFQDFIDFLKNTDGIDLNAKIEFISVTPKKGNIISFQKNNAGAMFLSTSFKE